MKKRSEKRSRTYGDQCARKFNAPRGVIWFCILKRGHDGPHKIELRWETGDPEDGGPDERSESAALEGNGGGRKT